MPTFGAWTVITMPSTPAPRDIEFRAVRYAAISISPFTGQQQTQDWGATLLQATVTMPPLNPADGAAWMAFLVGLEGVVNVCQLTASCFTGGSSLIPATGTFSGYWRLSKNNPAMSISPGLIYGTSFDLIEAK